MVQLKYDGKTASTVQAF